MTARTVRVRIAVVLDHTGTWAARGESIFAHDDDLTRRRLGLDDLSGVTLHWIEADVPVPVREVETVIEGRVSDAE